MKMKTIFTLFLMLFVVTTAGAQNVITRKPPKTQTTPSKPSKPAKPAKPAAPPKQNPPKQTPNQDSKPVSDSFCPDGNHPHMIDLGLPSGTKWACCNVGASKPEAYGDYYAWGETKPKSTYEWKTYAHCDGSQETCHDLGKDISGTQYDVAHVKWGGKWQMATEAQLKELKEKCTYTWTTMNGVKGGKFTGPNGKSIFFPAAGGRNESGPYSVGSYGYCWSSAQTPPNSLMSFPFFAGYFCICSRYADWGGGYYRYTGRSVRPVIRK